MANRLAHEVLGRSLDELPPQTRRLLLLMMTMVRPICERAEDRALRDHRFSRREVREFTGWGDTQLACICSAWKSWNTCWCIEVGVVTASFTNCCSTDKLKPASRSYPA